MDRANFRVQDVNFVVTKALPNGAATVNSDGLDTGLRGGRGALSEECELQIDLPALTTTELPDTKTIKVDLQMDTVSNFASPTTIAKEILVQTGAGGAGAAAASVRFRLATPCERYVRANATNDGTGDCSGKSMTVALKF